MDQRIYKYNLPLDVTFAIDMPAGARILDVQPQGSFISLWAIVDIDQTEIVTRSFQLVGTGHPIPMEHASEHIGTCQLGDYVWHVFELIR